MANKKKYNTYNEHKIFENKIKNNIIEFPKNSFRKKIDMKETPIVIKSIKDTNGDAKSLNSNVTPGSMKPPTTIRVVYFSAIKIFVIKSYNSIISKFYSLDDNRTKLKDKDDISSIKKEQKNGGGGIPPKPILIIMIGIVLICVSAWNFIRKNAQEIFIAGESIGIVKGKELSEKELTDTILQGLFKREGTDVKVNEDISIKLVNSSNNHMTPLDSIVDNMYNKFTFDVKASSLLVDGKEIAIVKNEKEANAILNSILNSYKKEGIKYTKEPAFVEKISIEDKFVNKKDIQKNEDIKIALTKITEQGKKHTITQGDTLYGIALAYDMSLEELLKINPQLGETSTLKIGNEVNLVVPVPFLSVMTYESTVYDEPIPKKIQYVENNKEYKTYKKVLKSGVDGVKQVSAEVVKVNGLEEDIKVISEKVIKEPTTEKIEVGTLKTPPKKAVGSFIYPTNGRLTSGYGSRWGTTHKALDLASSAGTPIKASDGGIVVEVKTGGWNGGYGNMVKINHQNGFETVYAHNSKNNVVVGQKVAQGEVIGYVGNTGDSTGNHVHFEIIENGVKKNPINYLR